jgi:hypothetical protein
MTVAAVVLAVKSQGARVCALSCALSFAAGVAHADEPVDRPGAFEVDRETPPPGQAELGFDGGAPVGPWAASVGLGYLDRPFRLRTSQVEIFPIEHRQTVALGGALSLGPSVVLDARLPLAHQVGDRMRGLGSDRPLDRWVIGDLALGLRIRVGALVSGSGRQRAHLFVRGALTLGTGDDRDYAGEARFTAAWNIIGRFTLPHGVTLAATAGVRFRGAEVIVADRLLGDELTGGIGATYALPAVRGVWCAANEVRLTAEVVGVLGNSVTETRGPSPVEARVGMISRIRPWLAVAGRVGTGLDDHIGAPRFRGMLELVYSGL